MPMIFLRERRRARMAAPIRLSAQNLHNQADALVAKANELREIARRQEEEAAGIMQGSHDGKWLAR